MEAFTLIIIAFGCLLELLFLPSHVRTFVAIDLCSKILALHFSDEVRGLRACNWLVSHQIRICLLEPQTNHIVLYILLLKNNNLVSVPDSIRREQFFLRDLNYIESAVFMV